EEPARNRRAAGRNAALRRAEVIAEVLEGQGMRVLGDAPMPGQPSEHPDLLRRRTKQLTCPAGAGSHELQKAYVPAGSGGRVAGGDCPPPAPSEPYVKLSPHTAQALSNAPRRTRRVPSVLRLGVDRPVAVGVQQLQVVERLPAPVAAPQPMVQVPPALLHANELAAHHASGPLSLPEALDPAPPCKRPVQSPDQPFFQVRLPRRIVGVGFAPYLPLPSNPHLARFHQGDRPFPALAVAQAPGEDPV